MREPFHISAADPLLCPHFPRPALRSPTYARTLSLIIFIVTNKLTIRAGFIIAKVLIAIVQRWDNRY